MTKRRMTALDGAKRKGYLARKQGMPRNENPYPWDGHLFGFRQGPRTWSTLFCEAWSEDWFECAAGKQLDPFHGLGISREILDNFGKD